MFIRARVAIISDVEGYIIEGNSFGQERTAQPGRILNLSLGWKEKNNRPKPSDMMKLGPSLRLPPPPPPLQMRLSVKLPNSSACNLYIAEK